MVPFVNLPIVPLEEIRTEPLKIVCWSLSAQVHILCTLSVFECYLTKIMVRWLHQDSVRNVTVDNRPSTNTSDHIPVIGTFHIQNKRTVNQKTKVMCKPKWEKCDKSTYKRSVRENLLPFDAFLPFATAELDILQPLSHLNAVL